MNFIHIPTSGYRDIAKSLPSRGQPVTMILSNGNTINYNYQGFDRTLDVIPLYWKPINSFGDRENHHVQS